MAQFEPRWKIPCEVSELVKAYLTCAEWTEGEEIEARAHEEGGPEFHGIWSREAVGQAEETCRLFFRQANPPDVWTDQEIGHDLWLTRNGHGTGFWDRDMPEAQRLADLARTWGERSCYVGDDGLVYFEGGA